MLGTGARYAEYGITGGFFLFTQALFLGFAYPNVLHWSAFGTLLTAIVKTIPPEAQPAIQSLLQPAIQSLLQPAIQSLLVALALLSVFIIGLALEVIGSVFMLQEAQIFGKDLVMNQWIPKFVEVELPYYAEDYRLILDLVAWADRKKRRRLWRRLFGLFGDAMVKQLTGAQVMAMAEDVPALQAMKPGGKEHPVDRVLHDGDTVTLGGMTLTAHLTPGHTRGCTTWTMKVQEGGQSYDVVIIGSLGVNPGVRLVNNAADPGIVDEFTRAFRVSRALPCDVPLGSHPGMYELQQKFGRIQTAMMNPFIDPDGYKRELDIDEAMFHAVLAQQQKDATTGR